MLLVGVLVACSPADRPSVHASAPPPASPVPPFTVASTPAPSGKGAPAIGLWQWTSTEIRYGQVAAWDAGDASGAHVYIDDGNGQRALTTAAEPLTVAGWWPGGNGLLVWHAWGYCNSCNADGQRLSALSLDGSLVDLANIDLQAGSYSWSPNGRRLLIGTGGDRFVVLGDPHVVVCDFPSVACSVLPRPTGQLDLTPAWSPDGRFIAFARAPAPGWTENINEAVTAWQDHLGLWIARADGTGQELLDTPGGSYPTWSDDGRSLYFIHSGQRWRHDLYSGAIEDTGLIVAGQGGGRGWITYSGGSTSPWSRT